MPGLLEGLKSGELAGKSRELSGKFGKFPGNLWKIALKICSERSFGEVGEELPGKSEQFPGTSEKSLLKSTVREVPGKSKRNFREVRGKFGGNSRDFPEAMGSLAPSQRHAKIVSKLYP